MTLAFRVFFRHLALLAAALLLPAVAAWAGPIPINNGTGAFAGTIDNKLYAIDFDSGKAVLLYTDATLTGINSLGFDPVKGIYYYCDNNNATTNRAIYGYDARTGQRFTLVADVATYGVSVANGAGLGSAGGEFANNAYYFSTEGGGAGNRDQFFKVAIDPASNGRTATGITAVGTDNFNGNTEFGDFLIDETTQKIYVFNSATGVDEYTIGAGSLTYVARDANTGVRQSARDRNNVFYDLNTGFRTYNPTAGTFGTVKNITTNGTTGLGALFDGAAYLPADASIGDRIFFDTNANGIDDGEDGIDGLTVELFDDLNNNGVVDAGETLLATRTTSATGAYLFDQLLPGDYIVRVSDPTNILNGGASTTGGLIQRQSILLIGATYLAHDFGFQDNRPTFSLNSVAVTEGTNAFASFTLTLSRTYTSSISVSLALANGTATGPDFGPGFEVSTNAGGSWTPASTATFTAGATSILVRTPIIDDALDENSETFTLTATRAAGRTTTASASGTATIADNDPAPSISINDVSRNENATPATFTVTLSGASGLTVTVAYGTVNGTATAGSDYTTASGTLTFNPGVTSLTIPVPLLDDTADEGNETFTVGLSAPTNATIADNSGLGTIVDNDLPPVANNDTATTAEDTNVTISVLANDTDPNGDALIVTTATVPAAQGAVTINANNTLLFAPALNFNGTATISYSIADGHGGTSSATVTVTVTAVNDAPVAVNDTATTPEDTAKDVNVLVNDTDVEGNTLSVTTATVPAAQGTVTINADKTLHFVPALNFNGPATISYSISDGNGGTASATVTVTVTPVNDAPVAVNDSTSTPEDTAKDIAVLGNDSDVDGDTLSVTVATVPAAQGTVTINPDKTLHFVPALNFNGTAAISYTISDGNGGTASATATVTVTAVNDNPVAVNDVATTPEETAKDIDVLVNDTDVEGNTLTVTTATVPAAQGTVTINPDKTLHFTPALNFNGAATITYSISDGNGGTAAAIVTVTVTPVNDAPVAVNDTATTPEETAKDINVLANDTDVEGNTLSVTTATVPAAQGTVTINADKTLHFVPALNFNGAATISYSISDGNGGTASAIATVTVTPVNDAPVAVNDATSTPEDTARDINVLVNDTDVDGDTLSVTVATVPAAQGAVTINADKTLHFVPALNFNGTATIAYTISDGNGGNASATATVTVTAVNDAPVAVNDVTTTPEDTAKEIDVLVNDTDVEGNTLSVTTATVPAAQGTVTINPDKTLHFVPALNFNGAATISYSISDGNGGTASAIVTVTVTPVNDAPVAVNDTATTPEETAKDINVLANDTDVEGSPLSVATATVPAAQGVVTINADKTLHFVPALNFNGLATITYSISDGNGGTASAIVTVTVTPVNDAPIAVNDSTTTPEDTAKDINVLVNDTDVDGDTLSVTTATVPAAQGTVTINADKTLHFVPALNFNGTATISYSISDGNGGTSSATVTVTVTAVNDNPVAVNDSASTPEDTVKTIAVLTNDTDPEGNPLTVSSATVPAAQGAVSINADGTLKYTPALNFNGTATINYSISDGQSGTASAIVTVTVTPVNDAPVAVDDLSSTSENTPKDVAVLANDTDVDGDTLTVTTATVPAAQGTVTINPDGSLHFVPKAAFNGTATISYSISDGHGGAASAFAMVNVSAINDPPIAVDDTATTTEDAAVNIDVLVNDDDLDGDPLSVTAATVPAAQGTVTINADQTLRFMPALNFNGPATIAYTIGDGFGGFDSATVTVTVTAVNDAPVAVNDSATTPEDTARDIAVLVNDTDVDGDTLTVSTATVPAAQGTVTINANGTLHFVPALNFNGLATISYSISDGHSGTASAQVAVTVTPANDAPVAVDDATSTPEDTAKAIAVLTNDTDVDGDTLTVTTATVPAAQGSVIINANGTVTYTPALNFNGPASITYTISDGNGGTATGHVTVTVTPVNDGPVAVNDTATTPEDTARDINALVNDTDVDGDTLSVTTATVPAAQGTVTINPDQTLHFVPALNFHGPATISYTISDGKGGTASAQVVVTITAVNDAPVAVNDAATTPEDTARTVDILANDSDLDGDTLTVTAATVPAAQGVVVINADKTIAFTPALNFNGLATISYSISDGQGGTASAQVAVTVTSVNDVPVANDDSATTPEDTAKTIAVLANDTDADGDPLTVTGASVPAAQGAVVVNADGTLTFTPALNFNGPATIAYTIGDGHGGTASANVLVTVTPVNDVPVASDDSATTPEDTAKTVAVLANDTDADGDTLSVTSATVPAAQGAVVVNANGTVTFTPALNFNGTATIAYSISDGHGGAASAQAIITVTPVNDAPVAVNDAASTPEDIAVDVTVLANDTDVEGDPLTVTTAMVPAAQGVVTINANGSLHFVPALNFNGTATISYSISDGHAGTASALAIITVSAVNDAPVAVNDSATTIEDTAVDIAVLTNDTDPESDPLSVVTATVPAAQGAVTINANGTLHFVPALNFNGPATISYSITDGNGGNASAQVAVTVTPVNDAPLAVNDLSSTFKNIPVDVVVLANDSDIEGDALSVTTASVPAAQGVVTINADGTLHFVPVNNFKGQALIAYSISDGHGGSASAQAQVTVYDSNVAPVALDDTATTPEDTAKTIAVLVNDSDADDDPIVVSAASVPAAKGTVSINANGTLLFTPAANFNGTAVISYTISDPIGATATATVTVTVTSVNDAPLAINDLASTLEDTAVDIDALVNDSDVDGDTLSITVATVPAAQGTVSMNANGTIHFVPALNFNGPATISYTISDGHGGTASATVTVTVNPVNDAPVAVDDATSTPEDTAVTINVLGNDTDVEGDGLTVTVATVPAAEGSVVINADGTLLFTPAPDFNGTATISYSISDGHGGAASAQAIVVVTPVNDAPIAVNDAATTDEKTAVTVAVLANDSDVDHDSLSVTVASVSSGSGSAVINADGTVTFTPGAFFNGTAIIDYTIGDGHGGSASAKVTITVTPVNDVPVAVNDSTTTLEDTAVTIDVLGNDTDADGDTLSVTMATVPAAQGTVAINGNGTLLFTPALNYNGPALISYSISDGHGGAASAVVNVTITPVNDAPVAVDDAADTLEATPVNIPVLANDSDVDNDALTVTAATLAVPAQGAVSINADGTIHFVPAAGFNGTSTINYTISDGHGGTASAKAIVNVGAVNDAPVAADDLAVTTGQDPVTADVVANDTDPENDVLAIQSATVKAGAGTVTVVDGSHLKFIAAPGFHGLALIEYTVADAGGAAATAILRVYVNAPPQAAPDSTVTLKNTAVTVSALANDGDADTTDVLAITTVSVDPAFGTAQLSQDKTQVIFTPANGLVGTALLTYSITDGQGGFAQSTISVNIVDAPVNQPPQAVSDRAATTPGVAVSIPALANDTDPENDPLTLLTATVPAAQGTVAVNGASLSFAPANGFTGAAAILYTISDGQGNTAQATAIVEVSAGNQPPLARDDSGQAASGTPKIFNVALNDLDPDGDVLTVQNATVTTPGAGTVTVNPDGTITFTPAPGFTGTAKITYLIADPSGATSQATISVDVQATITNTPPVTQNDTSTTVPGQPVTIAPLTNDHDAEGDILVVKSATVPPAQGTVTIQPDGTVIFTPAPGFTGVARIDYIALDPNGGETPGTITVLVNTPPVADPDVSSTRKGQPLSLNVLGNDRDADGHTITVISYSNNPAQGTLTITPTGQLTFTPAANFSGPAAFTYIIQDELGGQSEGRIQVMVNDPPAAPNTTAQTDISTPITLNVLAGATDPNGDPVHLVSADVDPAQGTVTVEADGTLLFTPAATFTGPAVITYLVADKWGAVTRATVTVGRGNADPLTQGRLVYCFCGVPLNINALRGSSDADGDTLTIIAVTQGKFGKVVILPDGRVIYRPGVKFNDPRARDSFTVTVSDGKGGTSQLTIQVAAFNSLVGNYLALVTDASTSATVGSVKITMGKAATFSGFLQYGTKRAPFIGRLGSHLDAEIKLKVAGSPNAKLHLAFDVDTQTFSGQVTGLGTSTLALGTARAVAKRQAGTGHTFLGKYHADVAVHNDPQSPVGDFLVTVNASGLLTVTGYLPDGRVFSTGAGVFANGQIPIYRAYGPSGSQTGGYVAGFITLNPMIPAAPLAGTLDSDFGAPAQLDLMAPTP